MYNFLKRIYLVICNGASVTKSLYYNFKYLPIKQACFIPIVIAKGVTIEGKGKITIIEWDGKSHPGIYIGGRTLKWMPRSKHNPTVLQIDGKLSIRPSFYFGSGGGIEVSEGAVLSFENGFNATGRCNIICRHKIQFGKDVLVSWDTYFMDSDQHSVLDNDYNVSNYDASVVIGNHVWIASNVSVLKNSYISDQTVVGSNTLIKGIFKEEKVMLAGSPARICKRNIMWSYDKPGVDNKLGGV